WAVYHDDVDMTGLLVRSGANVNAENRYGVPPLSTASTNGNATIVGLLLDAGADPNETLEGGETVLMIAARTGSLEVVELLLAKDADPNAVERREQTALMWAAAEGHTPVVETLIDAGADVQAKLRSGFTPMFFAVREGHIEVALTLLEAGVDVNEVLRLQRERGTSPLLMAVRNGHFELAVALIDPFPESIRLGAELIAGAMAAVCAGIVLFLRFPAVFVRLWEGLAHWLPVRVRRRGGQLLENAATALSALKSPGMLLVMLAYSLLKWLSSGAMVWLSLLAFDTRISLPVSMIVIAVSAVALTVPSAPGFFGAMQAAYVFALLPFGVSREIALAASVLALVFPWLTVTLFGGVCFAATGLRYREVRAQAEQVRG
ncbi:MAG: ankyrin repeat domain-containing protein, partial [SAR324 cluster bacterium]|nr:ankyrin repeat domain-containing protein [SAR324 cluster bacterium]